MQTIKSKKNKSTELRLVKLFKENGISGWRRSYPVKGHPDFAFPGKRVVVFVDGCFWHGHDCKKGSRKPKTNQEYWIPKIKRNQNRDIVNQAALAELGWSYLVIWECELQDLEKLSKRLNEFLK